MICVPMATAACGLVSVTAVPAAVVSAENVAPVPVVVARSTAITMAVTVSAVVTTMPTSKMSHSSTTWKPPLTAAVDSVIAPAVSGVALVAACVGTTTVIAPASIAIRVPLRCGVVVARHPDDARLARVRVRVKDAEAELAVPGAAERAAVVVRDLHAEFWGLRLGEGHRLVAEDEPLADVDTARGGDLQ